MSRFLGPIHYWLYGKIGRQEELTKTFASHALEKAWISDGTPYTKELPALETVIDEGNIHGWLQARIHDAETRYADLVVALLGQDAARLDELCEIAFGFGKQNALPAEVAPAEAYRAFEDFFVNGMPCDRVNAVTETDADRLSWEQTRELHAAYWTDKGGDPAVYYRLRKRVMDGLLSDTRLVLSATDRDHYTIRRR